MIIHPLASTGTFHSGDLGVCIEAFTTANHHMEKSSDDYIPNIVIDKSSNYPSRLSNCGLTPLHKKLLHVYFQKWVWVNASVFNC